MPTISATITPEQLQRFQVERLNAIALELQQLGFPEAAEAVKREVDRINSLPPRYQFRLMEGG